MTKDSRPLMVSIWCMTYNQEPYIRECLKGFVMQKTDFRFEAIVHDDASMDGTAAIVREYAEKYPDIIKPILETQNQWSKQDGTLERIMKETCKGKYIAFCEGDDYWTDPLKLQKQVDFLESNLDYSLIYTDNYIVKGDEFILSDKVVMKPEGIITKKLLEANFIITPTCMYRRTVLDGFEDINNLFGKKLLFGDFNMWLYLSLKGKVKYLADKTAAYRQLPNSASHFKSIEKLKAFAWNFYEYKVFFNRVFNIGISERVFRMHYYIDVICGSAYISTYFFYKNLIIGVIDTPELLKSPKLLLRMFYSNCRYVYNSCLKKN